MTYFIVGFRTEDGVFMPWRVCRTIPAADELVKQQLWRAADALRLLRATIDVMPIEGDG